MNWACRAKRFGGIMRTKRTKRTTRVFHGVRKAQGALSVARERDLRRVGPQVRFNSLSFVIILMPSMPQWRHIHFQILVGLASHPWKKMPTVSQKPPLPSDLD